MSSSRRSKKKAGRGGRRRSKAKEEVDLEPESDSGSEEWTEKCMQSELDPWIRKGKKPPTRPQDISGASNGRRRSTSEASGVGKSAIKKKGKEVPSSKRKGGEKVNPPVILRKDDDEESDSSLDSEKTLSDEEVRQCYGTYCQNAARPDSKYCSDTCGINLATHRILTLLATKVREYNDPPCVAQEKSQVELQKTKEQREKLIQKLDKLKEQRANLDKFFDEISHLKYVPGEKSRVSGGDEGSYFCVSCGQDFSGKTYLKHLEKCFLKMEKAVTLVSLTPATGLVAKEIICDVYNKTTKLYCKRLSVICPEHAKPNLIPAKREICGAPLTDELDITKICKRTIKDCTLHYGWEKLRMADIDFQRLTILHKAEALIAKEHRIQQEIDNRGGILGLLLHDTIDETKPKQPQPSSSRVSGMRTANVTNLKTFPYSQDPRPSTSSVAFPFPLKHNMQSTSKSNPFTFSKPFFPMSSTSSSSAYTFGPESFDPNCFPFPQQFFPFASTSKDAYPHPPKRFTSADKFSFRSPAAPQSSAASTSTAAFNFPFPSNQLASSTFLVPPSDSKDKESSSDDAVFAYPVPPKEYAKNRRQNKQ